MFNVQNPHLGRHGIDAWWTDTTAPEVADRVGDAKRPANADQMNIDGLAKVIDPQWLNACALANSRALARFVRQAAPDKRIVNLTRSGYAGSRPWGLAALQRLLRQDGYHSLPVGRAACCDIGLAGWAGARRSAQSCYH